MTRTPMESALFPARQEGGEVAAGRAGMPMKGRGTFRGAEINVTCSVYPTDLGNMSAVFSVNDPRGVVRASFVISRADLIGMRDAINEALAEGRAS